jgi:small-conductance mechanosensitive channel
VIDVGFFQTTIMEMGQPRDEANATWVRGRQFTGRIVTVANSRIFEEPTYNYTKDFPVLWDEIIVHLPLSADRARAESIALASAPPDADPGVLLTPKQREVIQERFGLAEQSLQPRVYFKALARSVEMTLRFVADPHRDRETKDAIVRRMLDAFSAQRVPFGEG